MNCQGVSGGTAKTAGVDIAARKQAQPQLGKEKSLELTPRWEFVADTVMGGNSTGHITEVTRDGRKATRLQGDVSLENNGGFVQMAFSPASDGHSFDASNWTGIEAQVFGNCETYEMRLRTDQLAQPWQSYRQTFFAPAEWTAVQLPFSEFLANKTDVRFDPARIRRIGVLAYGRKFEADVAISTVRLYR